MGYENVVARYDRTYREVGLDTILDMWSAQTGTLNVYVHSPFCASICKFCYYKGIEFDVRKDSALYDRYYGTYLPELVERFRDLLSTRTVGNYFFGGGTPSLMKPATMRSVFGLFPGFDDVRSKTFEIHPAIWDEEQLDVLAEHGFNCCIIGIQSFDENVLGRQGRIHATYEEVARLAHEIRRRGMYVAADLIYGMDRIDADAIFRRDLELAASIDWDVLSLQLNYDDLANDSYNEQFFELILGSELAARYRWEGNGPLSFNLKKTLKCFRLVRADMPRAVYSGEVFPFVDSLDEASKHVDNADMPSVVGFGAYRNPRKNTFSNIRTGTAIVEYIEVNHDWTPRYYITYESSSRDFFEECAKRLERLREVGPPPRGVKVWFENASATHKEDKIIRRVTSDIAMGVNWEYSSPRIEAYVAELKRVFPEWDWWDD